MYNSGVMLNIQKLKQTRFLAVAGALAFGLGGAMLVTSYHITFWIPWGGVIVMGALGGLGLGLALRMGAGNTTIMALASAAGFWIGHIVGVIAVGAIFGNYFIGIEVPRFVGYFLMGGVMGAVGGAMLGLVMRNKRLIIGLAMAGFLAFGIGYGLLSINLGYERKIAEHLTEFIIINTIGGMALGVTLGYLKERVRFA